MNHDEHSRILNDEVRRKGNRPTYKFLMKLVLVILALLALFSNYQFSHFVGNSSSLLRGGDSSVAAHTDLAATASSAVNISSGSNDGVVITAEKDEAIEEVIGHKREHQGYAPSSCEKYIVEHAEQLGYASADNPMGCTIWDDPNATNVDIHKGLRSYSDDLDKYIAAVKDFQPIPDVFTSIKKGNYSVCSDTKLHPDGLSALFPSKQLSLSKSGYIEPLTPPMRFHKVCSNRGKHLMSLDYLVHDFEAMCLNLKPTSKKVLIDMGASLSFHGNAQPIVNLMAVYEKFGFHFDHIYAFEMKFTAPEKVYQELLPEKYFSAYHWINVGVNHQEGHKMNPLNSILQGFDEDDFIVVKLDIDTSSIEVPLAKQLLKGGENGTYHKLIDQFYFEHHVHLGELAGSWGGSMEGTVKDSLELFYGLREKGIPAHFWP